MNKGCGETLRGVDRSMIHRKGFYTHLQRLRSILAGCRRLNHSPQGGVHPFIGATVNA